MLLVSEAEKQALGIGGPKVLAVGNGVDTDYFRPAEGDGPAAPGLVFTGTMNYRPNIDGVCWFVREVWPSLKREVPGLLLTVVGRDPAAAVRRLAEVPGVRVTGTVEDVRPYLASATLAVAPLTIARGIQNKVLEAMAMGKAVVASGPAIEGLDVAVGREILMADTPNEWRTCVLGLIGDAARRKDLERAARARAVADYGWSARMRRLVELCLRLAEGGPSAQGACSMVSESW